MEQGTFLLFLGAMSIIALFVFIALYFVKAGYGMFRTASWGISINNKLAWMLMEAPVFIVMLLLWWNSARYNSIAPLIFFLLFQLHYFQRAFVFPFLLKGKKMVLLLKSGISEDSTVYFWSIAVLHRNGNQLVFGLCNSPSS